MTLAVDPDGRYARKAIELIEGDKARLGRAVARQQQLMVARYAEVDAEALARNNQTILGCLGDLVLSRRPDTLAALVENIAQMRGAGGFDVSEFVVSAMCFFPVLRRFLVHRADSTAEGLIMFEAVEAVGLPFVGRVAAIFLEAVTDSTDPEGIDRHRFLSLLSESFERTAPNALKPIPIASVDSLEELHQDFDFGDGEDTARGYR